MPADLRELEEQTQRRRTFAIISHPDAGKTTLTEKLLLLGGAIRLAGSVNGFALGTRGASAVAGFLGGRGGLGAPVVVGGHPGLHAGGAIWPDPEGLKDSAC
jgi:hypothetical protein